MERVRAEREREREEEKARKEFEREKARLLKERSHVEQVNQRREFFYATPAEVRTALERVAGSHLVEYTETPEALEFRASGRKDGT
ncbi:hypothetical protein BJF79_11755 [Actinomadura sp. CNU-125]|uniref:hypothetical protein n=1 Tax=Actinomadura sp. CNU-125 TaxID=1904961 RepID=UPI00095A0A18|nr:hypothetical protein [Actinomadura sp. CNU-125]OLT26911.1 hypothetical protein BJF79_11755 [Actinomadura sp. CNU-125]